jgi:hypothetical protein
MAMKAYKMVDGGEKTLIVPPTPVTMYKERAETGEVIGRFMAPVDGRIAYISIFVEKAEREHGDDPILGRLENATGVGLSMGLAVSEGETKVAEAVTVDARQRLLFRNTGCPVSGIWLTFMFEVV